MSWGRAFASSIVIGALECVAGCASDVGAANCTIDVPDVTDAENDADVLRAPPGVCILSSGRDCRAGCFCDDGCNTCSCTYDNGVWSILETQRFCHVPPAGTRACTTGVDPRCVHARAGDTSCNADLGLREMYYCPPSCADTCPRAGCRLVSTVSDANDALWCCPP